MHRIKQNTTLKPEMCIITHIHRNVAGNIVIGCFIGNKRNLQQAISKMNYEQKQEKLIGFSQINADETASISQ